MTDQKNPLVDLMARYGPEAGEDAVLRAAVELFGMEDPDPWQKDFFRAFAREDRQISVRACHGPGKMEPVDKIVPTPNGDRRWGDLQPGDELWAVDGTPTKIRARWDHTDKQMYRVTFQDGSSSVVGGEHLWEVEELHREDRRAVWEPRVMNTEELVEEGLYLPNGPSAKRRKFRLPRHAPVEYPHRDDLPVDPYIMGLWLGDGDSRGYITNVDSEIHETLEVLGAQWKPDYRKPEYPKYWTSAPGLAKVIRDLGLADARSYTKAVPLQYRESGVEQRRALLQGLMDSDGTVDKGGSASFCTTSRQLMDDVLWLVRSLGGIAKERAVKHPCYRNGDGEKVAGRPAYRCAIMFEDAVDWLFRVERKRSRLPDQVETRYLHRWLVSVEPEGRSDAMCVMVDHPRALYLSNDFILTHNTAAAAICIGYSTLFRFPQRSVATAPTRGQLEGALMAEVVKWISKLPPALQQLVEVKSRSIHLRAAPMKSYFEIRTARAESPEALQGVHEDEGWVHLWVDEASGVHEKIFESAGGSMSGHNCQTVLLSNPTRTSGFFFRTHHQNAHSWHTIHVGWKDSKRVTDTFEREMREQYGEDSNQYRVRVLGEFPKSDLDTIIPYEYIVSAQERDIVVPENLPIVWGLDLARFGDDRNVLIKRNNIGVFPDIKIWGGMDMMQTANKVRHEWHETPSHERPVEILADVIGIGAGTVDRLREMELPVRGINVAETHTLDEEKYRNLRTELWFAVREWLMKGDRKLPQCDGTCPDRRECVHDKLATELGLLKYDFAPNGKLVAESKSDLKKRGYKSPDVADALMLSFASSAAGLIHGTSGSSLFGMNWDTPVSRGRAIV